MQGLGLQVLLLACKNVLKVVSTLGSRGWLSKKKKNMYILSFDIRQAFSSLLYY